MAVPVVQVELLKSAGKLREQFVTHLVCEQPVLCHSLGLKLWRKKKQRKICRCIPELFTRIPLGLNTLLCGRLPLQLQSPAPGALPQGDFPDVPTGKRFCAGWVAVSCPEQAVLVTAASLQLYPRWLAFGSAGVPSTDIPWGGWKVPHWKTQLQGMPRALRVCLLF